MYCKNCGETLDYINVENLCVECLEAKEQEQDVCPGCKQDIDLYSEINVNPDSVSMAFDCKCGFKGVAMYKLVFDTILKAIK